MMKKKKNKTEQSNLGILSDLMLLGVLLFLFALSSVDLTSYDDINNDPNKKVQKLDVYSFRIDIDKEIEHRQASPHNEKPVLNVIAKQGVYRFEIGQRKVPNMKQDVFVINNEWLCPTDQISKECLNKSFNR
ncbi:hypothetical protein [Vibrio parahaemolyticus]|uniref:hypothetical protein n=1 Tax=Vibrio parahaemolyticus TaxID=670 RepID=UPI00226AE0A9|nr:hypothetical protein [Vibrio parahaemolyticus]MCX8796073.1 hypothetical protein [Vibrio parahaemolyticus]